MGDESTMRVAHYEVGKLAAAAWEDNPRRIHKDNRERLSSALHKFGLVLPVVLNTRCATLVGGHQRVAILAESDPSLVIEVVEVDLDPEQHEEMALALNAEDAEGSFDAAKLHTLVRRLARHNPDLVKSTGLDDNQLAELRLKASEVAQSARAAASKALAPPAPALPDGAASNPAGLLGLRAFNPDAGRRVTTTFRQLSFEVSTSERNEVYTALRRVGEAHDLSRMSDRLLRMLRDHSPS